MHTVYSKVTSCFALSLIIMACQLCLANDSITGRFSNVNASIVKNDLIVSYQCSLTRMGNPARIAAPLDRLFCLVEYKDGSLISWAIYPENVKVKIEKSGEQIASHARYDIIISASEKQTEISWDSAKNIKRNFKCPVFQNKINEKPDPGKVIRVCAEVWFNGKIIASIMANPSNQLGSKQTLIPDKWYVYGDGESSSKLKYGVITPPNSWGPYQAKPLD